MRRIFASMTSWLRPYVLMAAIAIRLATSGYAEELDPSLEFDRPSRLASWEAPAPNEESSDQLLSRVEGMEKELAELRKAMAEKKPAPMATETGDTLLGSIQDQFDKLYDNARTNRYPNVAINGVFQADAGFFDQDDNSLRSFGDIQDGAAFRRTRLSAKGSVSETTNYFVQMDFAFFGRPTFTDVWVETVDLPVLGNVRVGQWKQPFSLEVVSSFRYTTFLERSLLFTPFTPFRHLGAGFYNHNEDHTMTWAASGFRTGQDQFGGSISDDGGWGTAERVTWLPYYDEPSEGRYYLHLGLGHFFSNPPNDTFNFRTVPEFYVGENGAGAVGTSGVAAPGAFNGTPFFARTGPVLMNNYHVFGSELLWVNGRFSLQSEAMVSVVDQLNGDQATLEGAYAQVGWFLTGEHRPYDRIAGAVDRIKPFENFFRVMTDDGVASGYGAWELAFRWSWIDLNDGTIQGGTLTDLTSGVNWYLNAYTKLMFNHIHAFADDPTLGESDTDIFAFRAQVDF